MGRTLGGLHDFDDSDDFEGDKLDDKLGKGAKIGGKRTQQEATYYQSEYTGRTTSQKQKEPNKFLTRLLTILKRTPYRFKLKIKMVLQTLLKK